MQADASVKTVQIFRFGVPSQSDMVFGLSLAEVFEVTHLPSVLPVPHSASFVVGLSLWKGLVIPVIDLAGALQGRSAGHTHHNDTYLVARIAGPEEQEILAWPILPGAGVIDVPTQALAVAAPVEFPENSLCVSIDFGEQVLAVLNLDWLLNQASL